MHFKSIFRALIARAGKTIGTNGNIAKNDDTDIVTAASCSYLPPTIEENDIITISEATDEQINMSQKLGTLLENIVVYIAGVLAKLSKSLKALGLNLETIT